MMYFCAIGGNLGGGVLLQYWQIIAPLGLGFVMEQAGTQLENNKSKCNGKTTNPVVVKKKG